MRITRRCKPTKGVSVLGSSERRRYFRFVLPLRPQPFAVERPSVTRPLLAPVFDRLLATALFGGAAGLLALAFWALFWGDIAAIGAMAGIPAAIIVGAIAAPQLARRAAHSDSPAPACRDGAAVVIWIYLIAAVLLAIAFSVSDASSLGRLLGGFAFGLIVSLVYGSIALVPALLLGAAAGWVFYRVRRGDALPTGAV